jgi:hypothetical protein
MGPKELKLIVYGEEKIFFIGLTIAAKNPLVSAGQA